MQAANGAGAGCWSCWVKDAEAVGVNKPPPLRSLMPGTPPLFPLQLCGICLQALHQLRMQQDVASLRLHWAQTRPATYQHDWAVTARQKNVKDIARRLVCGHWPTLCTSLLS